MELWIVSSLLLVAVCIIFALYNKCKTLYGLLGLFREQIKQLNDDNDTYKAYKIQIEMYIEERNTFFEKLKKYNVTHFNDILRTISYLESVYDRERESNEKFSTQKEYILKTKMQEIVPHKSGTYKIQVIDVENNKILDEEEVRVFAH